MDTAETWSRNHEAVTLVVLMSSAQVLVSSCEFREPPANVLSLPCDKNVARATSTQHREYHPLRRREALRQEIQLLRCHCLLHDSGRNSVRGRRKGRTVTNCKLVRLMKLWQRF